MRHYLKFTLFHLLLIPGFIGLTLGGSWLAMGLYVAILVIVGGDLFFGDDTSVPEFKHTWVLNLLLYLSLPLIFTLNFIFLWTLSDGDPLGYGALVESLTGYNALAARETNTPFLYAQSLVGVALLTAVVGTIVAHELVHRTWDPISLFIGRWLLAFSYDAGFSIEHVYGHHVYVGSEEDPATAPRGRNVYQHIIISTITGNKSAYKLEKRRLDKANLPNFSYHNRYLRGWLMSLTLLVAAYFIAGWVGAACFTLMALGAKALLEIVNYMEHYGMVRDLSTPVEPYHSWNANQKMSSWATFNLPRHSHHHARGEVPFWDLRPYPDAPMMINGYLTTIFLTLVPPLWNKLMIPKLIDWDTRYATDNERKMAREANKVSGLKGLSDECYPEGVALL